MTMRLPRFRLRTLMVAVAAAGLALAWVSVRARQLAALATYHAAEARALDRLADHGSMSMGRPERRRVEIAGEWRRHLDRAERCRRAASRPWLPVPADTRLVVVID